MSTVYIEHLFYSTALAVIVGMVFFRYTGRDPSWIIIAVSFVPDLDLVLQKLPTMAGDLLPAVIKHGGFHTILFLIMFSMGCALLFSSLGIRLSDALICSFTGISAHLFEDALIAKSAYAFFWPVSAQRYGIGIMTETWNFFNIGNTEVIGIGLVLLFVAIVIRTLVDGSGWWKVFLQGGRMRPEKSGNS
jgi:membrane-bound metal-dependent hydrolase YbcI (DUF457 family)